jgi:hypothetical protein
VVNTTTPTTIQGVSLLSGEKKRGRDVFDLVLSRQCIEVRRPERPPQQMSWDRVSEWEIEEREGYVLLTLRGQGATTPLIVPGWTLDDLEVLMREVTSGGTARVPAVPEPVVADGSDRGAGGAVAVVAAPASAMSAPVPPAPAPVFEAPAPATDAPEQMAASAAPAAAVAAPTAAAPTRAERRKRAARGAWRRRLSWRAVVTVVLLGVLATAVILVLLQSAGIIDWSFLGPVA